MANIYPSAGAALQDSGGARFTVWAPLRRQVTLSVMAPQAAAYPMEQDRQGYWHVTVPQAQAGMRYQYLLDDTLLRPDPASRHQPEGVHGPSALTSTRFDWTDDAWTGIPLSDMVIYELHTGAFSSQGNFQGVIARLPYLRSLGVNAIEIMPVAQFPGNRNWGYDGVYPFAVHPAYGGADGLKALVDAAHQQGIAVILDVVYNHLGPEGNYFADFGPYFTDKYHTPWGPAINFDDAWCDGVRGFYLQNALMWLDEFHIDGLRLDAVHAIWDCGARHFTEELSAAVDALQAATGRRKVLIAELDYNSPRYIRSREKGGYGLHGQWVDEFHHALHVALTGETNGYYADFGGLTPLAASFRDSYVYTGQYSVVRKRKFGVSPQEHDYSRFVVFTQNHDQVGNRMLGERLSALLPFAALKLAAAVMLLSPHAPLLFMGEEYGEKNPFLFFTDHGDPALIAALREGRRKEFASFAWEGELPDPQAEDTFQRSRLSWSTTGPEATALANCYRHLISLRRSRPALRETARHSVQAEVPADNDNLLLVTRSGKGEQLLLLFNFSGQPAAYHPAEQARLRKVFDAAATEWQGPGASTPAETDGTETITLPPYAAIVYEII